MKNLSNNIIQSNGDHYENIAAPEHSEHKISDNTANGNASEDAMQNTLINTKDIRETGVILNDESSQHGFDNCSGGVDSNRHYNENCVERSKENQDLNNIEAEEIPRLQNAADWITSEIDPDISRLMAQQPMNNNEIENLSPAVHGTLGCTDIVTDEITVESAAGISVNNNMLSPSKNTLHSADRKTDATKTLHSSDENIETQNELTVSQNIEKNCASTKSINSGRKTGTYSIDAAVQMDQNGYEDDDEKCLENNKHDNVDNNQNEYEDNDHNENYKNGSSYNNYNGSNYNKPNDSNYNDNNLYDENGLDRYDNQNGQNEFNDENGNQGSDLLNEYDVTGCSNSKRTSNNGGNSENKNAFVEKRVDPAKTSQTPELTLGQQIQLAAENERRMKEEAEREEEQRREIRRMKEEEEKKRKERRRKESELGQQSSLDKRLQHLGFTRY